MLDSSKILRNSYEKLWKKSEGSVLGRLMLMQCIKLLVSCVIQFIFRIDYIFKCSIIVISLYFLLL